MWSTRSASRSSPSTRSASRPPTGLAAHLLDTLLAGDGLARALASPGVGAGPLAAHRQAAAVTDAAVAADIAQPGDVLLNLPAQRALDRVGVVAVEDVRDAGDLLVAQLLGAALRIDPCLLAQFQGQRRSDAVDVTQRNVRRLVVGDVNTQDTRHGVTSFSPGAACDGGWCR